MCSVDGKIKSQINQSCIFAVSLAFHPWISSLVQHSDLVHSNKMKHRASRKIVESLLWAAWKREE